MRKHASVASRERFGHRAARRAWGIACDMEGRSLAEYISTSLSRTCPPTEAPDTPSACRIGARQAFQFGISRADLEGVADMIPKSAKTRILGISPIMSIHIPGDTAPILPTIPTSRARRPLRPILRARLRLRRPCPCCAIPIWWASTALSKTLARSGWALKTMRIPCALVDTLREQHGLDGLSAVGSVVFRTSSREREHIHTGRGGRARPSRCSHSNAAGPHGRAHVVRHSVGENQPRMLGRVALETQRARARRHRHVGRAAHRRRQLHRGEGAMFASMLRAARESRCALLPRLSSTRHLRACFRGRRSS